MVSPHHSVCGSGLVCAEDSRRLQSPCIAVLRHAAQEHIVDRRDKVGARIDARAHHQNLGGARLELLGERYCALRYEDLLQEPLEEIHRLWTFLGVETPAAGLEEAVLAEAGWPLTICAAAPIQNRRRDDNLSQRIAETLERALSADAEPSARAVLRRDVIRLLG